MRKNGKRFQVDIVVGSWFSTIHESMTQTEKKNFNQKTLHLVPTTIYRSCTFAVRNQQDNRARGHAREGERVKGIYKIIVFHLL